MKRFILFLMAVMAFSACSFAAPENNWIGEGDTLNVIDFNSTETFITRPVALAKYSDLRVVVCANDTATAGVAGSDSIGFWWAFRTFSLVRNSSWGVDTAFTQWATVDTLLDSNTTVTGYDWAMASGQPTAERRLKVDTLACAGFMCQSRFIRPWPDEFIQFKLTGIASNRVASKLHVRMTVLKKLYTPVRENTVR